MEELLEPQSKRFRKCIHCEETVSNENYGEHLEACVDNFFKISIEETFKNSSQNHSSSSSHHSSNCGFNIIADAS